MMLLLRQPAYLERANPQTGRTRCKLDVAARVQSGCQAAHSIHHTTTTEAARLHTQPICSSAAGGRLGSSLGHSSGPVDAVSAPTNSQHAAPVHANNTKRSSCSKPKYSPHESLQQQPCIHSSTKNEHAVQSEYNANQPSSTHNAQHPYLLRSLLGNLLGPNLGRFYSRIKLLQHTRGATWGKSI